MRTRSSRGFTLVELIVSVAIGGLLIGGMLQATFMGLRTMDKTNKRIAGSNDTQLIAGYFTSDVASAEAVSTTGTNVHAAPSVTTTTTNTKLVSFWTLKRATASTPPDTMTEAWDQQSSGANVNNRLSVAMADEALTVAAASGNRATESEFRTSSIGHSVVLQRASSTLIARRSYRNGSNGGTSSLSIDKPLSTAPNDVMLAQIGVLGGTSVTVVPPTDWVEVSSRNVSTSLKSVIYRKLAGSSEPASYTWGFPGGNAEAAGGIASYIGVSTTSPIHKSGFDVNPCGGETPMLLLQWTDRGEGDGTPYSVAYITRQVNGENHLVRQQCLNFSSVVSQEQTLARNLAASSVTATCNPTACEPLAVTVTLSLGEQADNDETSGRRYEVRGTTRTSPPS